MRKVLTALIAMGMLMSGLLTVSAQETSDAMATGLDTPAMWIDERGNQVATLQVTGIENDWQEYGEYSAPERGYIYVAVTFEVTNISGESMIVETYDFSLIDAQGRSTGRAFISPADDATTELFEEDVALAADETAKLTQVFQIPGDVPPVMLTWLPDSSTLVMIDISEGTVENSAIANGMNTPATWTDDRGNPVATIEVTGINPDWQDYGEYYEPERGMVYVAVDFTVTNVSSSNLILDPFDFSLVDTTGLNNGCAWVDAAEGAEPVFGEEVPLAAGESYEGTVVFALYADMQPAALMWQPDSGLLHLVKIAGGSDAAPAGTPAATPQG